MTDFNAVRDIQTTKPARTLVSTWTMISQLTMREVTKRFRSSVLGAFWVIGQPLLLLAVYSFVFSFVLRTRWGLAFPSGAEIPFSLLLFQGILMHMLLSDTLARGPSIIESNPSYVKRIVFPLEILPVVNVLSVLSTVVAGFVILLGLVLVYSGGIPLSALLVPLPLALLFVLTCGLGWLLSAIGVYFRDLGQFTSTLATVALFTAPICFPRENVPQSVQSIMAFNPLTVPVECVRGLLFEGRYDDWTTLGLYGVIAFLTAIGGMLVFTRLRRGFADVI